MATSTAAFNRDANRVPIIQNGLILSRSTPTTGTNDTIVVPMFRITGTVYVNALYGIVTTALGSNQTAAHLRINDQTAQVVITAAAGTTVSSAPVGSMLIANVLAATAITLKSAAAGAMLQPATVNQNIFSPSIFTQKTAGVNTDIEYVYTTNQSPTTGAIQFFCGFIPLSADGDITVI